MLLLPWSPRITASPFQNPAWRFPATLVSALMTVSAKAKQSSGTHQGTPSGPTRVNEATAASATSTTTTGSSAAIRTRGAGLLRGAERRSAAIWTASPNWPLKEVSGIADARRPVEPSPVDLSTGGSNAHVPGLTAVGWSCIQERSRRR